MSDQAERMGPGGEAGSPEGPATPAGEGAADSPSTPVTCAQCGRLIPPGEWVRTESKDFCSSCFARLRATVEAVVAQQSQDINYGGAVVGGLLGGLLGALIWWGFTVLTHVSFGLVAIVIGIGVGKGVVMLSGGKHARSLQAISVVIAIVSFIMATYWVNRTFILQAAAEQGIEGTLPFIPGVRLLIDIVTLDLGIFDAVFLGIAVWQSWKIPMPVRLGPR